MIEKILKTTNGKLKVKIPSTLDEITLGQMIDIQERAALNDIEAIAILSGIPVDQLQDVCDFEDFGLFTNTILSLSQQIILLYNSDNIPKKITLNAADKPLTIVVTDNLSVEPAGAFMAARDIIADEINEHILLYGENDWQKHFNPSLQACCRVLAHYFYCRATRKKYNEYEAEEFCAEIKKLRVTEALPIAKHFFICYPSLSKQKTNFLYRHRQHWRKKRDCRRLKSLSILTP